MNDDNEESRDEKRQRQMDFIIEQQAQFSVDIQQLKETHADLQRTLAAHIESSNARHERNESAIFALIEAQDRTNSEVRSLTLVTDRIADAVAALLDREARRENGNA